MKEHFCPAEQSMIAFEKECNWCGEQETSMIEVLKQALEAFDDRSSLLKWQAAREALRQAIAELEIQEPVTRYCCHSCFKTSGGVMLDRMIVCPDCGNKRCPKASNHALKCTNSNDPNQVGSIYTAPPQRTEQNFCSRCGKRTKDLTHIHTCTPPQD
jgi:hypothetical protein